MSKTKKKTLWIVSIAVTVIAIAVAVICIVEAKRFPPRGKVLLSSLPLEEQVQFAKDCGVEFPANPYQYEKCEGWTVRYIKSVEEDPDYVSVEPDEALYNMSVKIQIGVNEYYGRKDYKKWELKGSGNTNLAPWPPSTGVLLSDLSREEQVQFARDWGVEFSDDPVLREEGEDRVIKYIENVEVNPDYADTGARFNNSDHWYNMSVKIQEGVNEYYGRKAYKHWELRWKGSTVPD